MVSRSGRMRVVGIGGTVRGGSRSLGALRRALGAAREAGAEKELLELRELKLPMYEPRRPLDDYAPEVRRVGARVGRTHTQYCRLPWDAVGGDQ